MARKNLSAVERNTVASAVAKRYPALPQEDQQIYVSRILEYIADTIARGGYPASIMPGAGGKMDFDYLTIEAILNEDL